MKREMVFDVRRRSTRPVGSPPILSSATLNWKGVLLEQQRTTLPNAEEVIWINNVVIVQMKNPITLERRSPSGFSPTRILPGQITLLPAQTRTHNRISEMFEAISVSLSPDFMSMTCPELAGSRRMELALHYGVEDKFVEGICLALKQEVERGGASGRIYYETLGAALAVHLIANYSVESLKLPDGDPSGLSRRSVRQAVEYIDAHLGGELSLKDIARAAGLSTFHFARQFKQSIGLSPHQFVLRRRIERAQQLLLQHDLGLAEIASQVGFCDQSHLAQHFKRISGMTPTQFMNRARD